MRRTTYHKAIIYAIAIVFIGLSAFSFIYREKRERHYSFSKGEHLEFRVHYGMVNAGEAIMEIDEDPVVMGDNVCYKIDIFGTSTGMFDFFIRVRDNWGTYFDTTQFIPRRFYRYIEEGKYRKNEIVDFDHEANVATVSRLGKKTKTLKKKVNFDVPENCQDMVSGYYFLRTLDYTDMPEGHVLNLKGFFDDDVYDFKVRFTGREVLKTKIGKINTLVFTPIMPENSLFDGEDSIQIWLSDDKNKVPIKVKAKMFIGAVEIDIKSVDNLKYELETVED